MNVFTSFDGVRIAYHDEGEGPAVVLLHGYGLDGLSNFGDFGRCLPLFERTSELCRAELGVAPPLPAPAREGRPGLIPVLLAAGARVIVPDLRGFGASDKPHDEAAYANAAMARDVLALIGFLELDAVDVLGHSMGSIAAAKLLALGAPEVRSAILAGIGDYLLAGVELEFPESWPVPDSMPRPFTLEVSAAERARVLAAGKVERGNLASLEVIAVRAAAADPHVLTAVLRGAIEAVRIQDLQMVTVPVLVLNGRADLANQKTERLLGAIPTASSSACEGDHLSMLWEPTFHQSVATFFGQRWREGPEQVIG
jgi:pimeloyl-ACP methyl ester carboxylesterase